MLTKNQAALLRFITKHEAQTGFSPSFDEMRKGLKLKSKSSIARLVTGLTERGYLRRLPNRARAIEVVRMP
ncbi:MAG: hypothetical protein KGJ13_11105 [Patescibacteria group bacterium]|nr:hypothetical protein [Patescibacteria group bacterium]